jgi:hypothetical protein
MITYNEFRFDKDNDILYYFDFPISHTLYEEILKLCDKYTTDLKSQDQTEINIDGIQIELSNSIVLRSNNDNIRLLIPNDIDIIQEHLNSNEDIGTSWKRVLS